MKLRRPILFSILGVAIFAVAASALAAIAFGSITLGDLFWALTNHPIKRADVGTQSWYFMVFGFILAMLMRDGYDDSRVRDAIGNVENEVRDARHELRMLRAKLEAKP